MSKGTPEGRIKTACLRYLERRGFFVWNNPSGAVRIAPDRWLHFGRKGSSDIIGLLPDGRFLAVEVKSDHGRISPEQSVFLERIRGSGGLAVVVKSWQELDQVLREAGTLQTARYLKGGEMNKHKPVSNNTRTEAELTLLKECQKVRASNTAANTQITFINGHPVHWKRINGEWCFLPGDIRNAFTKDEIAQSPFLTFLTKPREWQKPK